MSSTSRRTLTRTPPAFRLREPYAEQPDRLDDPARAGAGARPAPSRMHSARLDPFSRIAGHLLRHDGSSKVVPRSRLGRSEPAHGCPSGEKVGEWFGVVPPVDAREQRVAPTPQPAYGGEGGLRVDLDVPHVRTGVEQVVLLAHLPLLHQPRVYVAAGAVEPGPEPGALDLLGGDQHLAREQAREVLPSASRIGVRRFGDRGEAAVAPLRPAGLDRGDAERGVLVAHASRAPSARGRSVRRAGSWTGPGCA